MALSVWAFRASETVSAQPYLGGLEEPDDPVGATEGNAAFNGPVASVEQGGYELLGRFDGG